MVEEPMWPATDAQIAYVLGLQEERTLPEQFRIYLESDLEKMERPDVSEIIGNLKKLPKKPPELRFDVDTRSAHEQWKEIPAGRYALPAMHPSPERGPFDDWEFYQVDKPTQGRWKGYVFVKQLFGSPGDFDKRSLTTGERVKVMQRIAIDPRQASLDFGKNVGACGVCGSPLTNAESRALGIGPVCARKVGW